MKKRARRVGFGMKPREGVEVPKESPTAAEVSGVEVQPEVPVEAVLEGVDGDSAGGALALESVQNLESQPQEAEIAAENPENEPIVAQKKDFEPPIPFGSSFGPDVPVEEVYSGDALAEMLKKSAEVAAAVPQFTAKPIPGRQFSDGMSQEQMRNLERSVYEDGKSDPREFAGIETTRMISFEEAAKMGLPPVDGADNYVIYGDGVGEMWKSDGKSVSKIGEELNLNPLGELPTGDTRATVLVREGYWSGVESAAKADGVSVEEWLTRELGERLEDTFFGRR